MFSQIENERLQLLASDPNVFEYDSLYDDLKGKKDQKEQAAAAAKEQRQVHTVCLLSFPHSSRWRSPDFFYSPCF